VGEGRRADLGMSLSSSGNLSFPVDVILRNADHPKLAGQDMADVRRLHVAHPHIAKVLVLGESTRDSVVNAFRSGVKGLFLLFRLPVPVAVQVHPKCSSGASVGS
jgi:PleD family two-component response regulator